MDTKNDWFCPTCYGSYQPGSVSSCDCPSSELPEPYYQDDLATIYLGDSALLAPSLGRFDLLLTDPPYGLDSMWQGGGWAARNTYTGEAPDWDKVPVDASLITALIQQCDHAIIWGGNYYMLGPARCYLVWNKPERNFTLAEAEIAWTNLDLPIRVFDHHRQDGKRVHPTQKPLPLMRWCLTHAPKAKTVLDPFMGSGTTLVAAKQQGLSAVGIEIDEKYCEAAAKRLSQKTIFEI